jgi:hypothetical protein
MEYGIINYEFQEYILNVSYAKEPTLLHLRTLQPTSAPKNDAPKRESDAPHRHRPISETQI